MKKVMTIMLVLAVAFSATAYAQSSSMTENTAMTKLGRGLLNIADAVVEIPGTMMRDNAENGAASAWTNGVFQGVVNTVKRAAVGVYEVASFPIPAPADYAPILDDPQFLSVD